MPIELRLSLVSTCLELSSDRRKEGNAALEAQVEENKTCRKYAKGTQALKKIRMVLG